MMRNAAKLLITAISIMFMAGCVSVQKQRSRAEQFYREHPEELAEKCATNFPPTYKPGKEVEQPRDTVYLPGDSVECPPVVNPNTGAVAKPVKVPCPPGKTIYIPSLRVDTVESTALLARVEQQRLAMVKKDKEIDDLTKERDEALKTAKNRLWYLIIVSTVGARFIAYKVYRFFKPKI